MAMGGLIDLEVDTEKEYTTLEVEPTEAIDELKPGSDKHAKVLEYLVKRINLSEDYMSQFYARWATNELKMQAYINLPDYEKELKGLTDKGEPPHPTRMIVPFAYAALSTMVTFLVHTFVGRRPAIQLGANDPARAENARNMETVLQYNLDHTRYVRHAFQHFNDIGVYSFGAWFTDWESKYGMRTIAEPDALGSVSKRREKKLIYEGNSLSSIDPFMFFPDPRVPLAEVNRRGEFVFWRKLESELALLRMEKDGDLKWVKEMGKDLPKNQYPMVSSKRAARSMGQAIPGDSDRLRSSISLEHDFRQIDQGTCWIVPKELGLGDSDEPEMWWFSIGNKKQIIQAERYDADHGMHPVSVSEPYGLGYAFGQPAPADFIGPIQDLVSWLVNSHIENVRAVLNDMWVVDPSRINMSDMATSGPGKRIRLKESAYGTDVRQAIMQLQVVDVTGTHMRDAELFMKMGMLLLGLNENLMGQTENSGRKTATESRQSAEAGVSRLAMTARIISGQSITDMSEQMVLNNQQYLSDEFYIQLLGTDGIRTPKRLTPMDIAGDFYYPIHDGTLPLDRVALLDVWKEIMLGVAQSPELNQKYDLGKIFEYTAELGGAKNIEGMKRLPGEGPPQLMEDGDVAQQVQQGNAIPAGAFDPGMLG